MAQIAYILLCHRDPDAVATQVARLTAAGDRVAIHFDARAPEADHRRLRDAVAGNDRAVFTRRRLRCGWGEWSLVAATIEGLRTALAAFPEATHFYLISGDCLPIRSAAELHAALDADPADHIECVDFHDSDWIRTGIRDERLIYRHWFNERSEKRLFYASLALQRRLGLRRAAPAGLRIRIGSQWWCLRRATVEATLAFCRARPEVPRFFRTTWIPDETFFQTLVRHLVPAAEIRARPPTFLMFTDYGFPVTFHDDHHDLLIRQDRFFARKVSPDARALRDRLGALYAAEAPPPPRSDDGRRRYTYLAGRGREGLRLAPRAWDRGATLGNDRELLILACKKWHVAKRLADRIEAATGIPALHYLFSEAATPLPDLGGLGATLDQRGRHRRAFLRLLFEARQTDRLVICLDPGDSGTIADLLADRARVRVLDIACRLDDAYLAGHARRVGLAGPATPPAELDALMPTLRQDLRVQGERLRTLAGSAVHPLREDAPEAENAVALAAFLAIPGTVAGGIAAAADLFTD